MSTIIIDSEFNHRTSSPPKALKIRLKVLGEDLPGTASSYNNLGNAYYSLGDYAEALTFLE